MRDQTSANEPEDVNVIRQDMRSLLGLDNSAPFPLMSARHLNRLTSDISSELPSDREVMKYATSIPAFPSLPSLMLTLAGSFGLIRKSPSHFGDLSLTVTTSNPG